MQFVMYVSGIKIITHTSKIKCKQPVCLTTTCSIVDISGFYTHDRTFLNLIGRHGRLYLTTSRVPKWLRAWRSSSVFLSKSQSLWLG